MVDEDEVNDAGPQEESPRVADRPPETERDDEVHDHRDRYAVLVLR